MAVRTLSPTPPPAPAVDDEWVNTESGFTFIWTLRSSPPGGGVWVQVQMTQPQPPPEPAIGDIWVDPASGITFVFRARSGGGGVWVQHMAVDVVPQHMPQPTPLVFSTLMTESDTPKVTTSAFPPNAPDPCDLWFDTVTGFFFIYYDDGNTRQWVVTNPGRGGTVGPPGPPGPPAVIWQGPWDVATTYSVTMGVEYEGSSYVAVQNSTGVVPGTDPDTWSLIVEKGEQGDQGPQGDPVVITGGDGIDVTGPTATPTISADATIARLNNPVFTGDPQAPTPATSDNDTTLATTAFVRAAITTYSPPPDLSAYALLNSPVFTGDPRVPTPTAGDDDTSIANTEWTLDRIADAIAALNITQYAPLASPAFTGTPTAPTPAPGDNDTSIATTAFVTAALASGASIQVGTTPPVSPGTNALWWNSELGQLFIWYNDGSTTQWVPASPASTPTPTNTANFTATASAQFTYGAGTGNLTQFNQVLTGNEGGWYNASTGVFTPPAGRYLIWGSLYSNLTAGNCTTTLRLNKNGVTVTSNVTHQSGGNAPTQVYVQAEVDANGTDAFILNITSSGGTNGANGQFGAIPVGTIVSMPAPGDGVLRLYSEQVLTTAAASIQVNYPINAKKIQIEYYLQTTGGADLTVIARDTVNGVTNAALGYYTLRQYHNNSAPSTFGGSADWNQTYYMLGGGFRFNGTLDLQKVVVGNGMTGQAKYQQQTAAPSVVYQEVATWLSGTAGSNGIIFGPTTSTLIAGSYVRCFVVT